MKRHCRGEHEEAHADMDAPTKVKNASGHVGQSRSHNSEKGNRSEQRTAFWTLVLSVSTGFLTFFTAGVFYYAIKQSQDVRESIGIARQTMVGDQRPWISGPDASYKDGRATFVFSNTGKTPATGISINGGLAFKGNRDFALAKLCAEADQRRLTESGDRYASITPNGKHVMHDFAPDNPFSGPDIIPSLRGNDVVVGCVSYGIPFDDKPHRTGFSIPIEKAEDGSVGFGETSTLFPD